MSCFWTCDDEKYGYFPLYCLSFYYVCYRFPCLRHTGFVVSSLSSKPRHIIWSDQWICIPWPDHWRPRQTERLNSSEIFFFVMPADVCTFAISYMVTVHICMHVYIIISPYEHHFKYDFFFSFFLAVCELDYPENKLKPANCSILCA